MKVMDVGRITFTSFIDPFIRNVMNESYAIERISRKAI